MTGNKHDKNKYKIDFPEEGYFNWKTVKIKNTIDYLNGKEIIGVLLHDGNFMVNGVLFLENQFEVIDENPMNINKYLRKETTKNQTK